MAESPTQKPHLIRLTPGVMMAIIGAGFVGRIMGDSSPVAMGAMQDSLGLTAPEAGSVLSLDGLMAGLVGLFIGPYMNRFRRVHIAFIGFGLVAVGLIFAILLNSYVGILLARAVVGFGTGVMLATHNASYGALRDPDRASGIATVVSSVLAGVFLALLPTIAREGGIDAMFATQLGFVALFAILMGRLPDAPPEADPEPGVTASSRGALRFLNRSTLLLLFGSAILMLGESMGWMLTERRGLAIGLSTERIGLWLGLMTFLGVLGAGIVAVISTRFGRFWPWTFGTIIFVAGIGLTHGVDSEWAYAVGAIMWSIGFFVQAPYFMGAVSVLDPQGRLGAIKGGAMILGSSSGALIGGFLVDSVGPHVIAPTALTLGFIAVFMVAPVILKIDRQG